MNTAQTDLLAELNLETGRLPWAELERHFARGMVVKVAADLDLLTVAAAMTADDKTRVEHWLASGHMARASSDDARHWHRTQAELWAIVVAPWVLVQA